jgi:excisionase family DNA binding protein
MKTNNAALLLTTSRVAELLGVHATTVKRWCDEGILPAEKTEGGHRRIALRSALRYAKEQGIRTFLDPFHPWETNVWQAVHQAEHTGRFDRLNRLALQWLSTGDTERLGRLFYEFGNRQSIPFTQFLDEGIRSFMALVGTEWQSGRLAVGEEHMASQVVAEVLIRLRTGWDRLESGILDAEGYSPVAVVGAMEGDEHDLGAQAVRVLLEREGWKVYYLGPNVPVEQFAEIQRAQGASLVCISFSQKNSSPDLLRAIRVLSQYYRPDFPYALGLGGRLGDITKDHTLGAPFQALTVSDSAGELLTWIRSLAEHQTSQDPRRVA